MSNEKRNIQTVRDAIDGIDRELLRLLAERRKCSIEAAKAKEVEPDWFRDKSREEQLLADRVEVGARHGLDSHYVTSVFHDVVEDSIRIQEEYYHGRGRSREGCPDPRG